MLFFLYNKAERDELAKALAEARSAAANALAGATSSREAVSILVGLFLHPVSILLTSLVRVG